VEQSHFVEACSPIAKYADVTFEEEALYVLYSFPNVMRLMISRRVRWAGHVAQIGEERKRYRVLVGKPEEMRPLRRPRLRREDGIGMDLREIG
jgi:hypothetical protein